MDMIFFHDFMKVLNDLKLKVITQDDFNTFINNNKDKFNDPGYLQIFIENVEFTSEFYTTHPFCEFFYNYMANNPTWNEFNFTEKTLNKLNKFYETFK